MRWEESPYNPAARREAGGVWNENEIPVTEWELPERRVVLPSDLQFALGIRVPVLRWDREKYETVASQHRRDLHVIESLSAYLARWEYLGEEVEEYAGNYRVLFRDEPGRWYAASMGTLQGSDNIITVFGSSKPNFVENRVRGLRNVVMREK